MAKTRLHAGRIAVVALLALASVLTSLWWSHGKLDADRPAGDAVTALEAPAGSTPSEIPGRQTSPRRSPGPPLYLTPVRIDDEPGGASATFAGRILSTATGTGVAHAELTFAREQTSHTVNADRDGNFHFEARVPGLYRLAAVVAEAHLPYAPAWGHSPIALTARPGVHIDNILIYLEPAVTCTGRVVDPDGRPVAGATATLLVPREREAALFSPRARYTTDADGLFSFQAPVQTLVEARHPSYAPARAIIDERVLAAGELTLQLGSKEEPEMVLSVAGRVLGPHGDPLPAARVVARRTGAGPFRTELGWWVESTDADGRFELGGLTPGDYILVASYPELAAVESGAIAAGRRDVILQLTHRGGRITGEVRARAGGAIVSAFTVVVSVARGPLAEEPILQQSHYDAAGRYNVGPLAPKRYLVRALGYGYAPSEPVPVDVRAGEETEVDFALSAGGTLEGTVVDADTQEPIAGARATAEGLLGDDALPVPVVASATADVNGRFRLDGLAPGLRSVEVSAARHHRKILSGLQVLEGAHLGPLLVALTPLAAGETPQSELVGIGVALAPHGEALLVGQVIAGGGAADARVAPGDAILAVDGQRVTDLKFEGAIQKLRGAEGTTVMLHVRKANGEEVRLAVTRRKIRG